MRKVRYLLSGKYYHSMRAAKRMATIYGIDHSRIEPVLIVERHYFKCPNTVRACRDCDNFNQDGFCLSDGRHSDVEGGCPYAANPDHIYTECPHEDLKADCKAYYCGWCTNKNEPFAKALCPEEASKEKLWAPRYTPESQGKKCKVCGAEGHQERLYVATNQTYAYCTQHVPQDALIYYWED
jgi:hypothetical protein